MQGSGKGLDHLVREVKVMLHDMINPGMGP